ncbi:probable disease resistance protein At5g66910 [Quercus lobata]|uniref:probable disease resistance protein At5g66910 n=1 Tax=Quercus lobata TaxID=97700 RepID=UPI0012481AE1|nr:probable disease resistance protein At5g66910 [Quercus lobata]
MEALCDNNRYSIGVCGVGGAGKTTLVKEVHKKAKESNLFKDIVMTTVSFTPDIRRIQGEIADQLKLKLDEESSSAKANQICLRIKSVEKILLILDDVWKDVELEVIGIPFHDDHKGCKILLTTRNDHVCNLMDCGRKIPWNFLSDKESLALIKKISCIIDDYPPLNDVVMKVVKECKEDYDISIEELARYMMGIDEFGTITCLEEMRNKVRVIINNLKDSYLLLEKLNVLKVLSLRLKVLSPESFDSFTNLRSLYLSHCIFTNIYSLGKLKRLEILSLYHCRMDALPNELGELQNLRLLDLMRCECDQQKPIPPGLLQRLSLLEQLYIVKDNFKDWDDANRCNVNLSELSSLSRLIVLSLHLSMKRIPEGFVFPDLQRYGISINSFYGYHIFTGRQIPEYPNSRILRIIKLDASSPNAFKLLFSNVEYLLIDSCGMEYLIDITGGNHAVMFSNLVKLSLQNLSCLRTICQGPDHQLTFSNLTVLELNYCRLLTKLLSPVVAQSLGNWKI